MSIWVPPPAAIAVTFSALVPTQRRVARLQNQQLKLVQMAYAETIPMDVLRTEQQRVSKELAEARREEQESQDSGEGYWFLPPGP
jgi:hypothetical protein